LRGKYNKKYCFTSGKDKTYCRVLCFWREEYNKNTVLLKRRKKIEYCVTRWKNKYRVLFYYREE
jgi:hypothetical protein